MTATTYDDVKPLFDIVNPFMTVSLQPFGLREDISLKDEYHYASIGLYCTPYLKTFRLLANADSAFREIKKLELEESELALLDFIYTNTSGISMLISLSYSLGASLPRRTRSFGSAAIVSSSQTATDSEIAKAEEFFGRIKRPLIASAENCLSRIPTDSQGNAILRELLEKISDI